MKAILKRFVKDESGATAIEYGLIAAGISVAIIAVVNSLGTQLKTTFSSVKTSLANAGTESAVADKKFQKASAAPGPFAFLRAGGVWQASTASSLT